MASKDIPDLLKHCAVAIYADKNLPGTSKIRFKRALIIAKARLAEYGFLTTASEHLPEDKVVLTAKGTQRNSLHAKEGKAKSRLFDKLYTIIEQENLKSPETAKETQAPPPGIVVKRK